MTYCYSTGTGNIPEHLLSYEERTSASISGGPPVLISKATFDAADRANDNYNYAIFEIFNWNFSPTSTCFSELTTTSGLPNPSNWGQYAFWNYTSEYGCGNNRQLVCAREPHGTEYRYYYIHPETGVRTDGNWVADLATSPPLVGEYCIPCTNITGDIPTFLLSTETLPGDPNYGPVEVVGFQAFTGSHSYNFPRWWIHDPFNQANWVDSDSYIYVASNQWYQDWQRSDIVANVPSTHFNVFGEDPHKSGYSTSGQYAWCYDDTCFYCLRRARPVPDKYRYYYIHPETGVRTDGDWVEDLATSPPLVGEYCVAGFIVEDFLLDGSGWSSGGANIVQNADLISRGHDYDGGAVTLVQVVAGEDCTVEINDANSYKITPRYGTTTCSFSYTLNSSISGDKTGLVNVFNLSKTYGIQIRDASSNITFDTSDATWSQVDMFVVAGALTESRSYTSTDGLEVKIVKFLVNDPPADRKALIHDVSVTPVTGGHTVAVTNQTGGDNEDTYVLVLAR